MTSLLQQTLMIKNKRDCEGREKQMLEKRSKLSESERKQKIMKMIKFYLKANKDLKEKNNNLQYNLSDLRALVKVVDVENDENMENLQKRIDQLHQEKERIQSYLMSTYKNACHLRKCCLFWKLYV